MSEWTDTDLLDGLTDHGTGGLKWVCRQSSTGRGLRLHQDPTHGTHYTPRGALEAFLNACDEIPFEEKP